MKAPSRQPRRGFLRSALVEASSLTDELRGQPQLRLEDLPNLPDEKLALIVPVLFPDVQLSYQSGNVMASLGDRDEPLFAASSDAVFLLNQFDGQLTLGEIAEALGRLTARSANAEQKTAGDFGYTRDVFLQLVRLGVACPGNPIY